MTEMGRVPSRACGHPGCPGAEFHDVTGREAVVSAEGRTPSTSTGGTMPSHPADGPAEADRCTFCATPRTRCESQRERDTLDQPCCVKCSHA